MNKGSVFMNSTLGTLLQKAVATCFKAFSLQLAGRNEKKSQRT